MEAAVEVAAQLFPHRQIAVQLQQEGKLLRVVLRGGIFPAEAAQILHHLQTNQLLIHYKVIRVHKVF